MRLVLSCFRYAKIFRMKLRLQMKKFPLWMTVLLSVLALTPVNLYSDGKDTHLLANGGFESATPTEFWQVTVTEGKKVSIDLDRTNVKEGQQSLVISADEPVEVSLRQEIYLPVGTLWRLTGSTRFAASSSQPPTPQIGIESPVGDQGFSQTSTIAGEWQSGSVLFRVPSPGRIDVTLKALQSQSGKVWFDDIRLEPVQESAEKQSVEISATHLGKRPIDLKQGGQFIEPLCDLLPSMIAQQVSSTSFEEEIPWTQAYKREVDRAYRPWYPDGSVHVAKYSFDSDLPFNGKRSQKIELPVAHTWAGISQDGFYLEAGHSYRLRLHARSDGGVRVRASLHAAGKTIAGPVFLGRSTQGWSAAETVLRATQSVSNATLTIDFEGAGTVWLDRVYLIDTQAVLGLWRPDAVKALREMHPGIVRFGGSTIEFFDWTQTVGPWDSRTLYPDDPWGGLQENFVGLEEFVQLVQYIGAEPLICVRWTGKSPQDAAHEIEYFNGPVDSEWGRKRARNGHREPYHIKYWQIGNEVSGPEYDASVRVFGVAMHEVDPSIKILSSFPSADTVRLAEGQLDYLCPHHYSVGDLSGSEEEFQRLQNEIERDGKGKDIRVAVTEWNTTGGEFGLPRGMLLTLGNALSLSRYQNLLHRYSDLVEITNRSNFSDSFGSGVIQPGPGWLYFTPTYFSQNLYQRAAGSSPLKIERENSLPIYLREPDLDASLSSNGKKLRIYAVNSTRETRSIEFHLDPRLGSVSSGHIFVLKDSSAEIDSEAMNSRDEPNRVRVLEQATQIRGDAFEWKYSPFSLTLLELNLVPKNEPNGTARSH
jgi:alpha-L-arabinofuranosidase